MYNTIQPRLALVMAITVLIAVAPPVDAYYTDSPTGEYLRLSDSSVWWFDNTTGESFSVGTTTQTYASCARSDGPTLQLKDRCGYCGYTPESWLPPEPAGSGWRHNQTVYIHGVCANTEIQATNLNRVMYRMDVKIKHPSDSLSSSVSDLDKINMSFRWYSWARYYTPLDHLQSIVPVRDNVSCSNDPPVSSCAGAALEWTPSYPFGTTHFCYDLALFNNSVGLGAPAMLNATVCN